MRPVQLIAARQAKIVVLFVFLKHNQILPTKFLCWNKWFVRLDIESSFIRNFTILLDSGEAVYTRKLFVLISRT